MAILPDGAIQEVNPGDLDEFMVVRVCDEFGVDLMKAAGGIEYAEARPYVSWNTIEGVKIPVASLGLLLRMKQTCRDKDAVARAFLTEH